MIGNCVISIVKLRVKFCLVATDRLADLIHTLLLLIVDCARKRPLSHSKAHIYRETMIECEFSAAF